MNNKIMNRAAFWLLVIAILLSSGTVSTSALAGFTEQQFKLHRDNIVQILARPNDPAYAKQDYLQQIGAEAAWDEARENPGLIIAVVDTGVDLEHPDLRDNLVPGINLIDPALPPRDDNGHGTQVAGILAAVANNGQGVSGLLWKAKIMPIKALDSNGRGDEVKLAEAIRYAVNQGAKIVVLSVGLLSDDPFLREVVEYAEAQQVLLVAATGNDEGNVVRYPAAYPTVLAVGGIHTENEIEPRSNYGPEIDVVAPWTVYTTAIGGSYELKEGTSMAAPQAAAVAALIWNKYPQMKPYMVRNHLKQTAQSLDPEGWSIYTGYGLIRADQALKQPYLEDRFEPNNVRKDAKPYAINRILSAALSSGSDADWFYVDSPYDGTLKLTMDQGESVRNQIRLQVYQGLSDENKAYYPSAQEPLWISVSKGRTYLRITALDLKERGAIPYRFVSDFHIYRDPFEDNDRNYKAYTLPSRSQKIIGTFDVKGDEDWFLFRVERPGTLSLKLNVDTARIDPVLMVQRQGEKEVVHDRRGPGEPELATPFDVLPGQYFLRVSMLPEAPAIGEYVLDIDYSEKLIDPNEPNDRSFQASMIAFDYEYGGVFDFDQDTDWFQFRLEEQSFVQAVLSDIPRNRTVTMQLTGNSFETLSSVTSGLNQTGADIKMPLPKGIYYLKLNTDSAFSHQMYHLKVSSWLMSGGFVDIEGHWARDELLKLMSKGILQGSGELEFQPDRNMTRAEAVAAITRAYGLRSQATNSFNDVLEIHWAHTAISAAVQAGIVNGYPDGSFRPDAPVTRMEMTAMLARALGIEVLTTPMAAPFSDVEESYWGSGLLLEMRTKGWISGYDDGSFDTERFATRAEFSALISRTLP
jgi:serine protease